MNNNRRNNYGGKGCKAGGRKGDGGSRTAPAPFEAERLERILEDCTNDAERAIWELFGGCVKRAIDGEHVNFRMELAELTAGKLAAMAVLEGYPNPNALADEHNGLCFDGYRDSFEDEAVQALVCWEKHAVPMLDALALTDGKTTARRSC